MLFTSLIHVALAGAATAITPSGFAPASNVDLIVAFGNTLALNGKSMTKEDGASTHPRDHAALDRHLHRHDGRSRYPPQTPGGPTGELLHWMQQDFTSSPTSTTIGGMQVFVLRSAANATAPAPYFGPSPPNKAPNTHRYTQLLLDTTGNAAGADSLQKAGATRTNFNAVNVVSLAGVKVVAGNSFDVTNGTAGAAAATGPAPGSPRPAVAINSATLVAANITKVTAAPQAPVAGVAAPSGGASATGAAAGNASSAAAGNGTAGVPGGAGGLSQSSGGVYGAALLALAAALVLF
ncbi:hypothetical protein PZA11_002926 [Diplocarpon coronariae]